MNEGPSKLLNYEKIIICIWWSFAFMVLHERAKLQKVFFGKSFFCIARVSFLLTNQNVCLFQILWAESIFFLTAFNKIVKPISQRFTGAIFSKEFLVLPAMSCHKTVFAPSLTCWENYENSWPWPTTYATFTWKQDSTSFSTEKSLAEKNKNCWQYHSIPETILQRAL